MQVFKDAKGRPWQIEVNVTSINRVKGMTQYDLLDIGDRFQRLATDPVLLVNVLYSLCEPQATAAGFNDLQFGEGFAGDAIDDASRALLRELADFFPKPAQRAAVRKLLLAMDEVTDKGIDLVSQRIETMLPQKQAEAMTKINLLVANLFIGSPESSELTPAP